MLWRNAADSNRHSVNSKYVKTGSGRGHWSMFLLSSIEKRRRSSCLDTHCSTASEHGWRQSWWFASPRKSIRSKSSKHGPIWRSLSSCRCSFVLRHCNKKFEKCKRSSIVWITTSSISLRMPTNISLDVSAMKCNDWMRVGVTSSVQRKSSPKIFKSVTKWRLVVTLACLCCLGCLETQQSLGGRGSWTRRLDFGPRSWRTHRWRADLLSGSTAWTLGTVSSKIILFVIVLLDSISSLSTETPNWTESERTFGQTFGRSDSSGCQPVFSKCREYRFELVQSSEESRHESVLLHWSLSSARRIKRYDNCVSFLKVKATRTLFSRRSPSTWECLARSSSNEDLCNGQQWRRCRGDLRRTRCTWEMNKPWIQSRLIFVGSGTLVENTFEA